MKWITIQQYVDLETGEMLKKKDAETNYRIIKSNKKTHIHEFKWQGRLHRVGHITRVYECKRNNCKQNTLW